MLYTRRTRVVDDDRAGSDPSAVPTIRDLLLAYKDRTGDSYKVMSGRVGYGIQSTQLQRWVEHPIKGFPKSSRTVELLSELLQVPVTTIVLGFAASLGIPVSQAGTVLERTLPPGTDSLTAEDREAIRVITKALVAARNQAAHGESGTVTEMHPPRPDPSRVAARRGKSRGRMIREEQDRDHDTP